jgi:hypothetical protein
MSDGLNRTATDLDAVAEELDRAANHARTAAGHFRNGVVPRGCAHILSIEGHLLSARGVLDRIAIAHAAHSTP